VGLPEEAKGALVTGVKTGSAAQMAGLSTGDLITRIGDKDITTAAEAAEALKNAKLSDGINLIIENREGIKSVFIQVDGK
jgi:S1-C subfamily serine protease